MYVQIHYGEVVVIPSRKALKINDEDFRQLLIQALLASYVKHRVRGIFVRDGAESIIVYEEGGIVKALLVKIPSYHSFRELQ